MPLKTVQIPELLFLTLYQYHVMDRKDQLDETWIKDELQAKFEAWKRRADYSADLERRRSQSM